MALVAGQIQPGLYQTPDYSGAAAAAGMAAAAPYQVASGLIGQVGDYFKQQGEKKKLIKQSSLQIDAALQLFPDLAPSFQGLKERMKDENIPLVDRAAEAEVVANLINTGIGEMRNRANMSFQQQQAMADAIMKQQQLGLQERQVQASEYKASQTGKPSYEIKKATVTTPTGEVLERDMPFNPKTGRFFDPAVGKEIQDINAWGLGQPAYAEEMPPTSQIDYEQLPSAGNWGFTSKTRDLLPKSTPDARQVSLDFNAAASKDAKGVEIIIPNDASAIERAAAMDYVNQTKQYFAERGVDVPVRGVRTAKENGRGTPGRFHTEPFFVGHAEARKVMESDPDGYAQVLANTLGRIPNVTFIPPHKTNDPGAASGSFNERDFAKNAIIPALERLSRGDLSQQAKGTPAEQAEMARMLEEASSMQTAEAIPSDAMPTEPRMAQAQPQPTPQTPQYKVRPGFVPVGSKESGTIMTQEQVAELERSGKRVSGVPTADGNFRVTSVSTATPQMGFKMTYDEQGRPILEQSATGVGVTPKVGEGQTIAIDASGRPTIVNIPGGKADIEARKAAQAAENERKFELDRANIVLSEIDKLIGYAGEMSRLPGASTYRKFAPMAGFERASEVENTLDTVKAGFRFETLQRLKEASPTGSSGLGAVTKPEFDALAEEKGKLTQVGDPRELQRRAINYKKMVLDTIHGSKQDREKLLKEGKITKEAYDSIESLYPGYQKKQPIAPEVEELRNRLLPTSR